MHALGFFGARKTRSNFFCLCLGVVAGAILVNQAAEKYITGMYIGIYFFSFVVVVVDVEVAPFSDKVKGTTWDTTQKIQQLMDEFERDTKKRVRPSRTDLSSQKIKK